MITLSHIPETPLVATDPDFLKFCPALKTVFLSYRGAFLRQKSRVEFTGGLYIPLFIFTMYFQNKNALLDAWTHLPLFFMLSVYI